MSDRKRVGILFGGRSPEHQISLLSAQNIVANLDPNVYEPVLIAIDKSGKWHYQMDGLQLLHPDDPNRIQLHIDSDPILLSQNTNEHKIVITNEPHLQIDVLFPILHGNFGEDGSIQGLAKLANLPCVGPGILGSAIGMDKDIMKKILIAEKIPSADFVTVRNTNHQQYSYTSISQKLGSELFIKPANLGSSVGISFVKEEKDFQQAIDYALTFDKKVIIERRIVGRELECAILGNDNPIASIPGEVIPKDGFYSYENKYIDESGAALIAPAELSTDQVDQIQKLAIQTYIALECKGMARVDMFLTPNGKLLINEINTIPGFTKISMYPKLWEISGISQSELITKLIEHAIEENESYNSLSLTL